MYNKQETSYILVSSAKLQKKLESFRLNIVNKPEILKFQKNNFDILIDKCFKFIQKLISIFNINLNLKGTIKDIFKMIIELFTKVINKIIKSEEKLSNSQLLENKLNQQQIYLEKSIKENIELRNDINKINLSLDKLLKQENFSSKKLPDILGHNSSSKIDFFQEENVRLGSELVEAKKKFEILKNELEKYENQRSKLISKINSVNEALNDTNVLTNVFNNEVKPKINIIDHKKIEIKSNIDLNQQVKNIFNNK